jgi:hypothetical protein
MKSSRRLIIMLVDATIEIPRSRVPSMRLLDRMIPARSRRRLRMHHPAMVTATLMLRLGHTAGQKQANRRA